MNIKNEISRFPSFNSENLKNKWDITLILILSIALFLWDINMNKVADFGIDYNVFLIGDLFTSAVNLMWIAGIIIIISITSIIIRSALNREGSIFWDVFIGSLGMVFFAFLLLGAVLQILHVDSFPFFTTTMSTMNAYHGIAIFGLIMTMIYFVWTD